MPPRGFPPQQFPPPQWQPGGPPQMLQPIPAAPAGGFAPAPPAAPGWRPQPRAPRPGEVVRELSVPSQHVGLVVGKGGANLDRMRRLYGGVDTRLDIRGTDNHFTVIAPLADPHSDLTQTLAAMTKAVC